MRRRRACGSLPVGVQVETARVDARWASALLVSVALAGCATGGARLGEGQQRYRCDQGIEFTVRFVNDTAMVDAGERGYDVLYRDAGGMTPQQSVYSSPRLRAEFGLGPDQRGAVLRYLGLPLVARCTRG